MDNEKISKKDFVEISFTGYANGEVFDTNREEDLRKLRPDAKPKKTIISVGQGMVVLGLDKAIVGKEIGKEYEIKVNSKEAFGERKRELIKTIPLHIFTERKINPSPGMILALDNSLVKIIAVSGARVIADFNNPLASKDLSYKIKIVRKVNDEKEKIESLLEFFFGFIPEFKLEKDKKVIIVFGSKEFESVVKAFSPKFEEILDKKLAFQLEKAEKPDKEQKQE